MTRIRCSFVLALALLGAGRALLGAESSLVFQETAPSAVARLAPLALTLMDGDVLLMGGTDASGNALTACERYHPASGVWSPTGSLAVGHAGGACVQLQTGRILVAGGGPTVEVYDPLAGQWSTAGTMIATQTGASIALCVLGDGEVLATTGDGQAQVWIDDAGDWSATGAMPSPVSNNGLIALPDGTALAVGGTIAAGNVTAVPDCSRFDPATGQWSATGSLLTARSAGQPLLIGPGTVMVLGGTVDGTAPVATCEFYDSASGTWSSPSGSALPVSAGGQATLLTSGVVLWTGGDQGNALSAQAAFFTPASGIWSVASSMLVPRVEHACAPLADGGALVIDGITGAPGGPVISASCERFDELVVNGPPTFVVGPSVTVAENSPPLSLGGQITDIVPGPLYGETVSFQVTVDAPQLFSVPPAIDASGTLTCTVAPDQSGVATVTVVAQNSGGTADGGNDTSLKYVFTLTVSYVNQPPTWTPGPPITISESSPPLTLPQWATAISPGPVNQAEETVTFVLRCDHPEYFSSLPQIAADGTFTCTPAAGRFGVTIATAVLVNSGGTAAGGRDTSAPVSIMITITQVIQPPTVPAVTIVSLVGATISAAVVILDPDGVLAGQGVPVYQITGVCALGQLSIGADGVAVLSATAVGSVAVPFTVTVGATVLTSSIQVVVTDPDAPRPRIVSFPATESGLAGAAWIYDLTIDPASLAADAQLTLSVQSLVPALANASWTAVSGTRFQIVVPSLDPSGGEIQRMQVVVTDAVNQSVDIQVILLVVLPPASTG